MTQSVNPFENAAEWDKVEIEGEECPGIARLSGWKRGHGWEIKKGKGVKGSTVTLNEYPPAEGTVTIELWTAGHFDEWATFSQKFKYDPTKKTVNAVDIYHPSLAAIDCNRVVCKEISAIEHAGGGLYKVTIALIEYNPPPKKPAVSTPASSSSDKDDKKKGTPAADARQAQLNDLWEQFKKPTP